MLLALFFRYYLIIALQRQVRILFMIRHISIIYEHNLVSVEVVVAVAVAVVLLDVVLQL